MKHKRQTSILAAVLGAAAFTTGLAQAGELAYVTNFSGQFGDINLSTGVFTPIGPGTSNSLDGLGGTAGGPFYGVDSVTGHLIRVAPNGSSTDVGDTGTGPQAGPGGVSINGSLTTGAEYAVNFSNHLLSIDPSNGSTADLGLIAALPPSDQQYIGNLVTSFSGNATDLFFTMEIFSGPNQLAPTLYDINPHTLAATSQPLIGVDNVIGSGWIGGQLYGFTGDGAIVTIDTATGVATQVATYDAGTIPNGPPLTGVFGAQATPEPATGMLLLAAGGLLWRRRSKTS
jgi:hypothetical protein